MRAPAADDVEVWYVDLAAPGWSTPGVGRSLADEERAHAARLHTDDHRRRFAAARVALRSVLASYTGATAASIAFESNAFGKPRLAAPWRHTNLQFNLSHSEDLAAIAVTRGSEVGIDVERIREVRDLDGISRFFTASERLAIRDASDAGRARVFFRCWTRKEACLKARGGGLSLPLDSIDVHPERPGPIHLEGRDGGDGSLTVWDLQPPEGYVGALAVAGAVRAVCAGWWRDGDSPVRPAQAPRPE